MKIGIRDLFWLVLLVSGISAWGVDRARKMKGGPDRYRFVIGSESDHPNFHERERKRRNALDDFGRMTDDELNQRFRSLPPNKVYQVGENAYATCDEYEPCLVEMARRGLVKELQEHYDAVMLPTVTGTSAEFPENLELLTALRRAQRKPDPLIIRLEFDGRATGFSKFHEPRYSAVIENVDKLHEPVRLEQGGDYRGGRLDKWRFVLINSQGREVSGLYLSANGGGGIASIHPLPFGGTTSWDYRFDLRSYLAPPRSGTYKLQALYHDDVHISDAEHLEGLIVTKSEPISVVVSSPATRWQPDRGIPIPIAMLFACLVLTIASLRIGNSGSMAIGPIRLPGISRRDFVWCALMIGIAATMWLIENRLDDTERALRRSTAWGEWSIRLADETQP